MARGIASHGDGEDRGRRKRALRAGDRFGGRSWVWGWSRRPGGDGRRSWGWCGGRWSCIGGGCWGWSAGSWAGFRGCGGRRVAGRFVEGVDDDEDEDECDEDRDDNGEDIDVAANAGGLRVVGVGFEGTAGFGFAGRVGHGWRPFYRIRRVVDGWVFPVLKSLNGPHPPPPPPGVWQPADSAGRFGTASWVLPCKAAFSVQRSAFSDQRSAISDQRSVFRDPILPPPPLPPGGVATG